MDMIREIDKGILDGINKLDGCLKDIAKVLSPLKLQELLIELINWGK